MQLSFFPYKEGVVVICSFILKTHNCLLINTKVVVKFMYEVELRDLKYSKYKYSNMCFISTNKQPAF